MKQLHLFCTRCAKTLNFNEYRQILEKRVTRLLACIWCGRVVLTMDIHEPLHLNDLRHRLAFEQKILQLCALTGMSVGKMEDYVKSNNLTLARMDNLIASIAEGKEEEARKIDTASPEPEKRQKSESD